MWNSFCNNTSTLYKRVKLGIIFDFDQFYGFSSIADFLCVQIRLAKRNKLLGNRSQSHSYKGRLLRISSWVIFLFSQAPGNKYLTYRFKNSTQLTEALTAFIIGDLEVCNIIARRLLTWPLGTLEMKEILKIIICTNI